MSTVHLAVDPMETDASPITVSQNGAPAPTLGQLPPELKASTVVSLDVGVGPGT